MGDSSPPKGTRKGEIGQPASHNPRRYTHSFIPFRYPVFRVRTIVFISFPFFEPGQGPPQREKQPPPRLRIREGNVHLRIYIHSVKNGMHSRNRAKAPDAGTYYLPSRTAAYFWFPVDGRGHSGRVCRCSIPTEVKDYSQGGPRNTRCGTCSDPVREIWRMAILPLPYPGIGTSGRSSRPGSLAILKSLPRIRNPALRSRGG